MIAELKVYGDCSSPNPTKVYTLYRMTPYLRGQIQDFLFKRFNNEEMKVAVSDTNEFNKLANEKYNKLSEEELKQELLRLFQIMFPEMTAEETFMLDYGDWSGKNGQVFEFLNTLLNYGNAEDSRALKN